MGQGAVKASKHKLVRISFRNKIKYIDQLTMAGVTTWFVNIVFENISEHKPFTFFEDTVLSRIQ